MHDEYLWVEKWRPKKVEDAILPNELYTTSVSYTHLTLPTNREV